jgi:hypothetical protein
MSSWTLLSPDCWGRPSVLLPGSSERRYLYVISGCWRRNGRGPLKRANSYGLEREALLDLAKRFAAALNTVLYLTWYAWKIPERVTAQALVDYEETMKELLGSLLGSHIGASSMSGRAFATIDPLIQQLYELDERIALEIGHYDDEPDDARNRIGSLHEAARRLERQSVDDLRSMLQLRSRPEPDQHAPGVTRAAPE